PPPGVSSWRNHGRGREVFAFQPCRPTVLCLRMIRIKIFKTTTEQLFMNLFSTPAKALRLAVAAAALGACGLAMAEPEAALIIKDHRFQPAELKVPAGQRVKLTVHNQDATPEE